MVHSGGFYVVEKRKTPSLRRLHWFRWEAAMTWLSGALLLTLVYYMGGGMVDADVRNIAVSPAVLFGGGMIAVGFYVLEKRKPPSLRRLHWVRWEAAMTWLSGALLLTLVYYMGGGMVDADVRNIAVSTAVLFGVGMIAVGWE